MGAGHGSEDEFRRLVGAYESVQPAVALVRWSAVAAILALFAWRSRSTAGRRAAQGAAALLAYGAVAQILPSQPAAARAGFWSCRGCDMEPQTVSGRAIAGNDGLARPYAAVGGRTSADLDGGRCGFDRRNGPAGDPATDAERHCRQSAPARFAGRPCPVPDRRPAATGSATLGGSVRGGGGRRCPACAVQAAVFDRFRRRVRHFRACRAHDLGSAAARRGAAAWRFGSGLPHSLFRGAALAHLGWYSLLLHNPLWAEQAVGPLPLRQPAALGLWPFAGAAGADRQN